MGNLIIIDKPNLIPTTDTLKTDEVGINTADEKIYVNNGTDIISIGGGGVFKPSNYIENERYTILRDDFGVGVWATVLNINSSVNIFNLALSTVFTANSDDPVVQLRVTRDGEVLPVLQISKVAGSSQNQIRHYTGKLAEGIGLSTNSSTIAGQFSQLSSSHGIYCRDSLLVEVRIVSGNSATCGGQVEIDYQEGTYE